MAAQGMTEQTTAMALLEKSKLIKSLRRFDLVFFTLCALVGLDTLGTVANKGAEGFTWLIVLAVFFVVPYMLVMAEVGSAFTQEGGPYEWVKLAFGRLHGSLAAVLYWITNPLWVGGSLAFIATDAWSGNIFKIGSGFTVGNVLFKLTFVWIAIGVAIVSLKHGKWIPNLGAFMRVFVLGFFTITLVIYAIKNGVHGFAVGDLSPSRSIFLALVPLLLFNYVGFELANGAAEEMQDPQHDVPISVLRSGVLGVALYAVPILGILLVLPGKAVTNIGGFLDAINATFHDVYGGAAHVLLIVMAVSFVGTLVTSGAVWMIGSDRILAVASYDGAFFRQFGVFNRRFGTPVRVNVMSGVVSSIFCLAAIGLTRHQSTSAAFTVVLYMAISTTLVSYLWLFPAALKLRYSHPNVPRPYTVPGGMAGMWICVSLITGWTVLGSFVAIFPGVLEKLFGIDYNFVDNWGLSRTKFELYTLVTLGIIMAIGAIGYAAGARVRNDPGGAPPMPPGAVPVD